MFAVILLAAGLSARFGSPKALASVHGEPVIRKLQNALLASSVDKIIIVLGAAKETIQAHLLKHKKVEVVYNKDYKLGQTSSFQAGLKGLRPDVKAVLLLPVDYPGIKTETINVLLRDFQKRNPAVLVPVFGGRKGHPPVFSSRLRDEVLQLGADEGVNQIIQRHAAEVVLLPVDDPGVVLTFNTPGEFEEIKKRL